LQYFSVNSHHVVSFRVISWLLHKNSHSKGISFPRGRRHHFRDTRYVFYFEMFEEFVDFKKFSHFTASCICAEKSDDILFMTSQCPYELFVLFFEQVIRTLQRHSCCVSLQWKFMPWVTEFKMEEELPKMKEQWKNIKRKHWLKG
jgi:hypothetical protein